MNVHRNRATTAAPVPICHKDTAVNAPPATQASTVKRRSAIVATTPAQRAPCAKTNPATRITHACAAADTPEQIVTSPSIHARPTEIHARTAPPVWPCNKDASSANAWPAGRDKCARTTSTIARKIHVCSALTARIW